MISEKYPEMIVEAHIHALVTSQPGHTNYQQQTMYSKKPLENRARECEENLEFESYGWTSQTFCQKYFSCICFEVYIIEPQLPIYLNICIKDFSVSVT